MPKSFEEMNLIELYTAMVAADEKIAQDAQINFVDPSWQKRRERIAAIIEERFPDVPTEPFAVLS